MAEPASRTAAGGSAIAATAIKSAGSGTVTATLLPLDPITMTIGLVTALVALLHITPPPGEIRTPYRVFALVAGSGFLAGVFVPITVAGGVNYLPWISGAGDHGMQWAAAAIIGAAPHVLPLLWKAYREWRQGSAA